MAKQDHFNRKAMLYVLWDELLKPDGTVDRSRYRCRAKALGISNKVTQNYFLDDNIRPHQTNSIQDLVESYD